MRKTHIVERLASYTGLSWRYIEQTQMRINIHRFVKEFMREEGYTIGRLDSRVMGIDYDDTGAGHEYDPSYEHGITEFIQPASMIIFVQNWPYENDLALQYS